MLTLRLLPAAARRMDDTGVEALSLEAAPYTFASKRAIDTCTPLSSVPLPATPPLALLVSFAQSVPLGKAIEAVKPLPSAGASCGFPSRAHRSFLLTAIESP